MAVKFAIALAFLAFAAVAGASAPTSCCLAPQFSMLERMDCPALMPSPGLWTVDVAIDSTAKKLSSTISNGTMHWQSLALGATMYSIDITTNKCYKMATPPSVFGNLDMCVGAKSKNHKQLLTTVTIAGVEANVWGNAGSGAYDPRKDMPTTVTVDTCLPVGMGDDKDLAVFYNYTTSVPATRFAVPAICNSAPSVDSAEAVPHPTLSARSGLGGMLHRFV